MKKRLMYGVAVVVVLTFWGISVGRGELPGSNRLPSVALPGLSWNEDPSAPKLDVPYVPTPHEVVREMLHIAGVKSSDVLYDLGCGDGRIVITAAKMLGVRGVGVDIDPQRIRESNENARKAGVTDKVQFLKKDLFSMDISKASVVTMYLLSSINMKLRPKLFRELKPGTRIVSHDFDMDDWTPDRQKEVNGHTVYYWVIPANVSGTWKWSMSDGKGEKQYTLRLRQKFQKVSGTLRSGNSEAVLSNVQLTGDHIRFTAAHIRAGSTDPVEFVGKVKGNRIEGSMKQNSGGSAKLKWSAQRDSSTKVPLDSPAAASGEASLLKDTFAGTAG